MARLLPLHQQNLLIATASTVVLALQVGTTAAQSEYFDVWADSQHPTPEYRAASVVTNLWLAAFAVTSCLFGVLGAVVAIQWPNPRIFCYKTAYSDMPSTNARSCCSLYSLNLGFCVFWLLVFAIMVIAKDVVRIVVCLCFCLVHISVVVVFRMKFKRFGRPERQYTAETVISSSHIESSPAGTQYRVATGIPIYNIPMQTVVVGGPADSSSRQQAGQSQYWYDAACMPPQQQPGMYGMSPTPSAGAAAVGAGPFGMPIGYAYPSQPSSTYGSHYRSSYPEPPAASGQPATVARAVVVPAAAPTTAAAGHAGTWQPVQAAVVGTNALHNVQQTQQQ